MYISCMCSGPRILPVNKEVIMSIFYNWKFKWLINWGWKTLFLSMYKKTFFPSEDRANFMHSQHFT